MSLTKKQWLNQTIMCDEWGRPPSLADVPLTYMPRRDALKKRSLTWYMINKIYNEAINV
jgi:hypothetical protein